jgi:hypothetical protein
MLIVVLRLVGHQAGLPRETQESVQKLISIHKNWGDRMSTPGATIVAEPDDRKGGMKKAKSGEGYTLVPYLIHSSGLPTEKVYRLVALRLPSLQPQVQMQGIGLNLEGVAVCPGKPGTCTSEEGPNDPIDLIFPAAKGEVGHFALVSEDGQSRAMFTVTPFPIRSTDKGCTLELQRLMPHAELAYLAVSGLPPDSELRRSYEEEHEAKVKADARGLYESALLPAVKGKDHGILTVNVTSAACALHASMEWGTGSERPQ